MTIVIEESRLLKKNPIVIKHLFHLFKNSRHVN